MVAQRMRNTKQQRFWPKQKQQFSIAKLSMIPTALYVGKVNTHKDVFSKQFLPKTASQSIIACFCSASCLQVNKLL